MITNIEFFISLSLSPYHNRKALCCKMSVEFDSFIASNKKWFCHFDDDNYVNVPRLVQHLRRYNPLDDWYLGKPSIKKPLEIQDRDSKVIIDDLHLHSTTNGFVNFSQCLLFRKRKFDFGSLLAELDSVFQKHLHLKWFPLQGSFIFTKL